MIRCFDVYIYLQMAEVTVYCMSKAAMDIFTQCLSLGMFLTSYSFGRKKDNTFKNVHNKFIEIN